MIKFIEFDSNFLELSFINKTKYILNLLEKHDLKLVINSLINYNKDTLECFNIINSVKKYKIFKQKYNLTNIELISIIINSLIEQNKTKELNKYLKQLEEKKLKLILNYEITNKTLFSRLKLCKDLVKKYNLNSKKEIDPKDRIIDSLEQNNTKSKNKSQKINSSRDLNKKNNILKKQIKSKKAKWSIGTLIMIFVFTICYILLGYLYSIIFFYNTHIYPNIYLNNKLIEGFDHEEIITYLEEYENKLNEKIGFKNVNETFEFTYSDIGVLVNTDELQEKIINNYEDLNGFFKLKEIFLGKELKYEVTYSMDEVKYQEFLNTLSGKVNVPKQEEKFSISNGNINYTKGINGFVINTNNLESLIIDSIIKDEKEISLNGHVETVKNTLGVINKKVGTFTTYYNEAQGRSKNIRNAISKLNGKILYPNETFSFYKTVGPYNSTKGYIFYDKDVGSGVCQVSTTIYNVALLLNLPIVSRSNHGDMVYYVDYGLDATVYGSSVDFKFKNNSSYPIYIEASANNGNLTVSFWSNENIIKPGYSYKPRVEKVSSLSYRTFLDTYYNGNFVGSTFLNSSYYSKGKH
ncbi:MAG: VanW family protein [Bacilli bacterium]|nr:VanW family protein [Bacilli bacterium]